MGDSTATDMLYLRTHREYCKQSYKLSHPDYVHNDDNHLIDGHSHSIYQKIEAINPELDDQYRRTLAQRRLKVQTIGLESAINRERRMDTIKAFFAL